MTSETPTTSGAANRYLAIYLRDHVAGSAGGVALIGRARRANEDSELGDVLAEIEREVIDDLEELRSVMRRLDVAPSRIKRGLGRVAELVARLKSNGRIWTYSPGSRVVELEALAAAITTKRNLWRALAVVADSSSQLDRADLQRRAERSSEQLERVLGQHATAVTQAFVTETP
jgi:hypothetical protein